MLIEVFHGYTITARPYKTEDNRWGAAAHIARKIRGCEKGDVFKVEDRITFALETEAAHESINLGKNLIMKNLVGF